MKNKLIRTTNTPDLETKRFQDNITTTVTALATAAVIATIPEHVVAYSSTEHAVGTWIDGRTIYEKTIDFGALPNATTKSIAHEVTDIDYIIQMSGVTKSEYYFLPLPFVHTSTQAMQIELTADDTNVTVYTSYNYSSIYLTTYITIRYVKTVSSSKNHKTTKNTYDNVLVPNKNQ